MRSTHAPKACITGEAASRTQCASRSARNASRKKVSFAKWTKETFLLARRKGFEPLTFWSVAMVFPSHRFSSLSKNADISRVFGIALFIASDNFRQFSARLCAKCAPKNRYKTGSLLPFIPRCVILSMALLRERRGAAQRQAVGYTTRKGVRLCQ